MYYKLHIYLYSSCSLVRSISNLPPAAFRLLVAACMRTHDDRCRLLPFAYLLPPAAFCLLAAACMRKQAAAGGSRRQHAGGSKRQHAAVCRRQQAATSGSRRQQAARCGIVKASLSRFIAIFAYFYILLDMHMVVYAILLEDMVRSRLPH